MKIILINQIANSKFFLVKFTWYQYILLISMIKVFVILNVYMEFEVL